MKVDLTSVCNDSSLKAVIKVCVTHRFCTCGIKLNHLYKYLPFPHHILGLFFLLIMRVFSCALLNETLFNISSCLRFTVKSFVFLIAPLRCALSSCFYTVSHLNRNGLFGRMWKDLLCQDVCKWMHTYARAQPCHKTW